MPSFHIINFGCRAAQSDGAALERQLRQRGLEPAEGPAGADLVILNTCTVTGPADEDARNMARRVHRQNPGARILVTGCYAQRAPQELLALPGVAWVVGNSHKTQIADLVSAGGPAEGGLDYHSQVLVGDISAQREFLSAPVEDAAGDRTRPNLKIQDGCGNRCSFCVIPSVRGGSRSARPEDVVAQVRTLGARYREVVLSGINLGRWGRDLPGKQRLADLVRRLIEETPVERLRLSSVEPMDWTGDLLGLMAESSRLARHVHIPLQSGSDAVLRRMFRRYRPRHYEDRARLARTLMPDAAIGADVMVGFPGETDAEFEESRRFIESLPFTYLHVFTYSPRPGTPAADLPAQVPAPVKKRRNAELREIAAAKNLAFRRSLAGKRLSVVTLDEPRQALSANYVKVELAAPREPNRLVDIEVGGLTAHGVRERPVFSILPV